MKKLLVGLVALGAVSSANAISLRFSFDVNSSGPSIYACNAGIQHARHDNTRICYDRVTADSCSPNNCPADEECNCVCTGGLTSDAGEYRHDFMRVSYADWTDNGVAAGASTSKSLMAGQNSAKVLFSNGNYGFDKQLTSLEFNLGSERYGAEYFVDVCYRGPQIEYWANRNYNDTPNFLLNAQATVTDVEGNAYKYSEVSNLKMKAEVICDLQGIGNYVYAHNGNGEYDTLESDLNNAAFDGDLYHGTPFITAQGHTANLINNYWLTVGQVSRTPRFCKVRYTFKEDLHNNTTVDAIRKWQIQQAQVCTYTEINEDLQ